MIEAAAVSADETIGSIVGAEFEFDDSSIAETADANESAIAEVEDAPVVRFLHKMLLDAFSMRASDIHFEPYAGARHLPLKKGAAEMGDSAKSLSFLAPALGSSAFASSA